MTGLRPKLKDGVLFLLPRPELAPFGTFEKKIPADIVAKVKARQADILSGKFTVKVDDAQPKSTAK